jgi:photosystem II stability/assembly factor-like uncharacterized protein
VITLPTVTASTAPTVVTALPQGPLKWTGAHANVDAPVASVFGIGRDLFAIGPSGVRHSSDGAHWTKGDVGGAAIWGTSMDELWIAADGVMRSSDRGATWKLTSVTFANSLIAIGGRANDVFAGGIGVLFHTTDHGATWKDIHHGIANATFMAITTAGSDVFVVGLERVTDPSSSIGYHTESIILRSSDATTTFTRLVAPKPGMTSNEESRGVCFTASGTMILAMSYSVYASSDRGATWKRAADVGTEVLGVACRGSEVMAVARNKHFLQSRDDGATWEEHALDAVLPGGELIALESVWIGADGTALVAGEAYVDHPAGTLLVRAR